MPDDQGTKGQRVDERGARPLEEATQSTGSIAADYGSEESGREHNVGLSGMEVRRAEPGEPGPTHGPYGSGRPHVELLDDDQPTGQRFELREHHTHIGSSETAEIQLAGLPPVAVTVLHDEHDEYVLSPPRRQVKVLRTGARIELGRWTLVFVRDEGSDHGRPYGGISGEGGLDGQQLQPPRPDYRDEATQAHRRQAAEQADRSEEPGEDDAATGME